ncbi:hypothetical protein BYT27DRAFT_7192795 [Phlegmacium glaucopus]|nr:hypothetical protein BYT27DRAFT_7192795 [Phlegmacium glaucopus]
MKYLATIFSLVALIALVPARIAADDGKGDDNRKGDGNGKSDGNGKGDDNDRDHHHCDPHRPQVLWGQCDGWGYGGTKECPEGAYCRWFSDWYSQCNPNGQ